MFALFAVSVIVIYAAESHGTPAQQAAGVVGANLEGKELRFGTAGIVAVDGRSRPSPRPARSTRRSSR